MYNIFLFVILIGITMGCSNISPYVEKNKSIESVLEGRKIKLSKDEQKMLDAAYEYAATHPANPPRPEN